MSNRSNPLDEAEKAIVSLVEIAGKTVAAAATGDPVETAKVEGLSQSYLKQVELANTLLSSEIRRIEEAKTQKSSTESVLPQQQKKVDAGTTIE